MKQITLNLDKKQQRPMVLLQSGLTALLDTGAFMPVWTGGKELLEEEFGGESQNRKVSFSGFGGKLWGDLYSVTLSVGDLIFNHMSIIVSNNLGITPYQFIMSATMFDHLIYEVDMKWHKLNIKIPDDESFVRNLRLVDKNGKMYILCHSEQK